MQVSQGASLGPKLCGWTGLGPLLKIQVSLGNGLERKEKEEERERESQRGRGVERQSGRGTCWGCIKHILMPLTHAHFCVSDEWWAPW